MTASTDPSCGRCDGLERPAGELAPIAVRCVLCGRRSVWNEEESRWERWNEPLPPIGKEVAALERSRMREALGRCGGNRTRAAALIQMPLRTFVTKMRVYQLAAECPPSRRRKEVASAR